MNAMGCTGILCLGVTTLGCVSQSLAAEPTRPTAAAMPTAAAIPPPKPQRDGQHDFDYAIGAWKEHTSRLKNPLTGSSTWVELDGHSVTRKVLSGRGNLTEYEGDGPNGHLSLIAVRLYDPKNREWSMNFSTPERGALWPTPMVGQFQDGRGEFYSQDEINGRTILVRFTAMQTSATSARTEQAFSADGGKTWETNWINTYTRMTDGEAAHLAAQQASASAASARVATDKDGRHDFDFDFDFGTWKTHIARLDKPLARSEKWHEYNGTWVVRTIWNGRANLVELEADGPAGHMEGMGLRLYNPESHQWSLNWVNGAAGKFGTPTIGEFKNGRGEFYDTETFNGRVIMIRNIWSDITPTSCKFEQAFSVDGGKTWESNWISTDTRTGAAAANGT